MDIVERVLHLILKLTFVIVGSILGGAISLLSKGILVLVCAASIGTLAVLGTRTLTLGRRGDGDPENAGVWPAPPAPHADAQGTARAALPDSEPPGPG